MPVTESTIELFNETGAVVLSDVIRSISDLPVVPVDQITFPEGTDFLDNIGIVQFETIEQADFTTIRVVFLLAAELRLDIPGLEGFALVAGSIGGGGTEIALEVDLAPDYFAFRIIGNVALRFARHILKPVIQGPNGWEEIPDKYSEIRIDGTLRVDGDGDVTIDGFDAFDLSPSMIADSGVVIEAEDIVPILSGKMALPASSPPEIGPGWRGVFIKRAALHLPEGMNVPLENLAFENCYVGSGGFTGEVLTTWTTDPPTGEIFGVTFSLTKVHLGFRQNALTQSAISGTINLPFFDEAVDVEIGINVDGDFTVRLASESGLYTLTKPNILSLELTSLGFEMKNGDFLARLSGAITLLYGGVDWPEVEVRELSIDKDGHVRIDGGWLDLPRSASLDFNGFSMELTKIGFGKTGERNWIGFSGGIRLVDELTFGASVEGLKVLWNSSGNVDLQMSAIRVELEIPDTLTFKGFVEYFQEGETKGFKGDIGLKLYPLDTSFDASLIVGRNQEAPPYNFFYIFVDADLPAGIPLGQTNLAIYGFSALMGNNVAPTKTTEQEWFQWYLLPPIGTTSTEKWSNLRGSQGLGAGITLGTAADNGYAFTAKTILILLLPGPLLLIDGKANMLEDRSKLSGDSQGQYRALAILDRRAGTFLVNIQPRYKYDPITGAVIDVIGLAEGFFDFNRPEAWHLYLGQAEPSEKRIRAKILKGLFKADAYLMLDQPGMRLGASVGYDESYKFGPLAVDLKALIEGQAEVSWRPIQVDGTLTLEGLAALRAFGFSSSASVNALLEVQTPKPYHVFGEFRVKLKTPWPLPDPSARITLEWGDPDGEPSIEPVLAGVAAEHLKTTETWNLPSSGSSGPVIPLDAKLLLSFNRPVADRALVGSNAAPSPARERVGPLEVAYELVGLELLRKDRQPGSAWTVGARKMEGEAAQGDLFGMWLPLPSGDKAVGKLQLWSRTPFTYVRNTGRSYADWFTERYSDYPCPPQEPPEEVCTDFESFNLGRLPVLFIAGDLIFESLVPEAAMWPQIVKDDPEWLGTKQALLLASGDAALFPIPVRITLAEPASQVRLFIRQSVDRATLKAYGNDQVLTSIEALGSGDHELVVQSKGIEYVEVLPSTGPGYIRLLRACFAAQSEQDRAIEIDSIRDHLKKESQRWCNDDYLLQPNSEYRLIIRTRMRRWRDDEELDLKEREDTVYFRTSGPPGFLDTERGAEGLLRDLRLFVDENISTPANGAEPVYRGYDIRMVFNENYMERMYSEAQLGLSLDLRDRNGQQASDARGRPLTVNTHWDRDPCNVLSDRDELWIWTVKRTGCQAEIDSDCIPLNNSLETSLPQQPLAPESLLEARVMAGGRELYRSSFVTSRFVTFTHHIHSFQSGVWDHDRLAGESGGRLLSAEELAVLEGLVRAKREGAPDFDEGSAFETISRPLFKLGQRPWPDHLEITSLRDTSRSYALLLESPEPIDWRRTSLVVRQAAEVAPSRLLAISPVKIIEVAFGTRESDDQPDYNTEWVEVLVREDADLSGFTIEHSGTFGPEDSPFTTYYRFGEESVVPAGTIVRVHSGTQADDSAPALERVHRYVTPPGGEGNWLLNSIGDTLRLLDASSREVHRWSFLPSSAFQDLHAVLIRNVDQTRTLIFIPDSQGVPVGNVPEGRFRLAWQFLRDIGPNTPVLKRGGNKDPEDAAIEFDLPAHWP